MQRFQGVQSDAMQLISSCCKCADVESVLATHSYENSWISGAYYVCFEEEHAPICFWNIGVGHG